MVSGAPTYMDLAQSCGDRGSSGRRSPSSPLKATSTCGGRAPTATCGSSSPTRRTSACSRRSTASTRWRSCDEEFGAEVVDDTIAQMQELDVIEDAADDDLIDPAELRALRPPAALLLRHRPRRAAALGVPAAAARGEGRGARRRRARRLDGDVRSPTCGIGEMWLIDGDRVEISNLNRQILYSVADLGLLKVEVAAARLRAFNPEARITATARRLGSDGRDRRLHRRRRRRHRRDRLARLRRRASGATRPASRPASPTSR